MASSKRPAVIIDLDGTLCDTSHRQHHMEKKPKDWMAFYAGIADDQRNEWCQRLIDGMEISAKILFVSGRPDNYRQPTLDWLERRVHTENIYALYMRKEGDYRKDSEVKTEIYQEKIEPYYEVLFCVDDRQQVVDAWRALGLVCLQCAKGNF